MSLTGNIYSKQRLEGEGFPRGNDGISPIVEVTENDTGHRVEITDVYGTKTFDLRHGKDGEDGYTPQKGIDYFDGYTPVKGVDYFDGANGDPGYTPVKGVDYFDGKDGYTPQKGVDYFDGKDGKDGEDGYTPQKGVDYFDGKDGYTPVKGKDYFDGKDGKDGVDGDDYVLTEADLAEIAEQASKLIDIPEAGGDDVVWVTVTDRKCSHTREQIQELAASGKVVLLKNDRRDMYTYYLHSTDAVVFVSLQSGLGASLDAYCLAVGSDGNVSESNFSMPADAVRWYVTQTMPEENKAIARSNIGAAADAEVIKTVNGIAPDASGNVEIACGSSESIIDVVELPTEKIDENNFYRLLSGTVVYNQYAQNNMFVHCVYELPETCEPLVSGDLSNFLNATITGYYNIIDGSVSGYVNDQLSTVFGVPAGWYPVSVLMGALGYTFSGVITDILDDPNDGTYRLLLEYVVYFHKEGKWTSQKTIGWDGEGNGAEVFNLPFNKAYGYASHAEGRGTVAGIQGVISYGQHAEGQDTVASGSASHAEGFTSHAEGAYSHAEGQATVASGENSHAEGAHSHAEGSGAHAEGAYSHAEGLVSHAEGFTSHAEGAHSHAEGYASHATGRSQHVQGEFNAIDPEYNPDTPNVRAKYAHIVGNGESAGNRSNAHTLDWQGNAWFAGDVYIGGTSMDDPNAKKLGAGGEPTFIGEITISTSKIDEASDGYIHFGKSLQAEMETILANARTLGRPLFYVSTLYDNVTLSNATYGSESQAMGASENIHGFYGNGNTFDPLVYLYVFTNRGLKTNHQELIGAIASIGLPFNVKFYAM